MSDSWRTTSIGEVCEVIAGQSPKSSFYNKEGVGVPFHQGKKEFNDKFIGPATNWTEKVTRIAEAGDILMSVRAPVGPVNYAIERMCVGRGLAAIRPGAEIESEFLFNFLVYFEQEIIGNAGAVFNSINKSQISAIELPFPPQAEQKRIVSILDEAFSAIAKAKENAEKNLANARELFESYLNRVFTQQGPGWQEKPLVELCVQDRVITYGVIKLGDIVPNGVPCLRTSNVKKLRFETAGMKRIAKELSDDYSRTILQGGEVLVNVRGTLGGVAVVPSEMIGWNVSREVAVAPIDATQISPEYAAFCVASKAQQDWLTGVKKGAAYTGINIEDLRQLPIRFPRTLENQQKVVDIVNEATLAARRLETIYTQKLANLNELKQSLLQKAFTGQLTATGRVLG